MILFKIRIKNTFYGVSFSFFLVIALTMLCTATQTDKILLTLVCCALHEMGHLLMMTIFGTSPKEIVVYGGGIRITPDSRLLDRDREIAVLLAGAAVNFILGTGAYLAQGCTFFSQVNFMLGIMNMLPFRYFDGGRVLSLLLKEGKACDLLRALFIFLSAIAMIQMILNGSVSVSFAATFCFIVLSEIIY